MDICYFHQVACYLSLKGDTVTPFLFIDSTLHLNSWVEHILSKIDFTNLHKTQQWKILTYTLIQIYLRRHPDICNKSLSVEIWLRGIEDQKSRTLVQNNNKDKIEIGSKEWKKRNKEFRRMTNDNADFVVKWIKNHNFPYYSEVGQEAGDAAVLFIAHINANRIRGKKACKKTLPAIKQAVDIKEADSYWYAVVYDRYCTSRGKKQVYGTHVYRHPISGTQKTGFVWSNNTLSPIEDEKNVDVRRAELGLESLKDYAKKLGIDYEYNAKDEKQGNSSKNKKNIVEQNN